MDLRLVNSFTGLIGHIAVQFAHRFKGSVHTQHRDTGIQRSDVTVGHILGHRAAAAGIHLAQFRHLPDHVGVVQHAEGRIYSGTFEVSAQEFRTEAVQRGNGGTFQQKLLAAAGEMADAPDNIFGSFAYADLTFADAVDAIFQGDMPCDGSILTNPRQYDAIRRSYEAMLRVLQAMQLGHTPDAVLTDIECAMEAMGEVTGATVREDITARIFERFCVGK